MFYRAITVLMLPNQNLRHVSYTIHVSILAETCALVGTRNTIRPNGIFIVLLFYKPDIDFSAVDHVAALGMHLSAMCVALYSFCKISSVVYKYSVCR